MKNTIKLISTAIIATIIVQAQPEGGQEGEGGKKRKGPPTADKLLERFDTDGDSALSYEEFELRPKSKKDKQTVFDHIDENGDGLLSKDEISASIENMKERRKERRENRNSE